MASTITLYSLYCISEAATKYVWSTSIPTECPDNGADTINNDNIIVITSRSLKVLTALDSPFYVRKEFLQCDTTDSGIDVYLPKHSNKSLSFYITRTAGTNNVTVYESNGNTQVHAITDTDNIYKFVSDGSSWSYTASNTTPEDGAGTKADDYDTYHHNKGDIVVGDDTCQSVLPVGTDGQHLVVDSSKPVGMKWDSSSNGIFGSQYHYVESLEESSTTTTDYTQNLRLTTGSLPAGDYHIGWNYNWRFTSEKYDFKARVQVDDTTTVMLHNQEAKETGSDQYNICSGWGKVTLTAGIHDIDLDFGRTGSQGTAYIRNAKLEIWRIN